MWVEKSGEVRREVVEFFMTQVKETQPSQPTLNGICFPSLLNKKFMFIW